MTTIPEAYKHINGWGIDADPRNNPTYPIKKYTGDDHQRLSYERPTQQEVTTEVLHSNERPSVSAVFGTSVPPSGLSGRIRRYAFRFSEGSFGHWLPLLLADRVQVFEAIAEDIRRGHVPNLIREKGWTAEWKYNRKGLVRTAAITAVILTASAMLLRRRRQADV